MNHFKDPILDSAAQAAERASHFASIRAQQDLWAMSGDGVFIVTGTITRSDDHTTWEETLYPIACANRTIANRVSEHYHTDLGWTTEVDFSRIINE